MNHWSDISATDATAVSKYRLTEIENHVKMLQDRLTKLKNDPVYVFDWGDVGSLSHILEQLEECNQHHYTGIPI